MTNTPQDHAIFSASSAHRWMNCAGSLAMEQGLPDSSSSFAEEGTAAHEICSMCLKEGKDAQAYLGWIVFLVLGKVYSVEPANTPFKIDNVAGFSKYEVDQNMVDHVQTYLDIVRELMRIEGAILFVEQRVQFGHVIGIPGQFGTSDATIVTPGEIIVVDFKYGMGVEVSAHENPQLMLYALGAMSKYELIHEYKKARMIIVQPRIEHLSEWDCSIEDLLKFGQEAKECAAKADSYLRSENATIHAFPEKLLNPGVKQCKFCKAKATCPALAVQVMASIVDDFEDLEDTARIEEGITAVKTLPETRLAAAMNAAPLVEMWVKAVREAVYQNLMSGIQIPGFKLVRGKQGNRKWADEKEAQSWLYHALGQKSYKEPELISPTEAEKIIKKAVKTPQWVATEKQLKQQKLIPSDTTLRDVIMVDNVSRTPAGLSVAPESDDRPAESPAGEIEAMFENLGEE